MRDDNGQDPTNDTNGRKGGRRPSDECFTLFGFELWGWRYAPGTDTDRRADIRAEKFRFWFGTTAWTVAAIATGSAGLPLALRALGAG